MMIRQSHRHVCQAGFPAWVLQASFLALSLPGLVAAAAPPAAPTYWQDIRPVFRKHCVVCHSGKNVRELDVSGGLALDSYEGLRKGSKRPVFQAGNSGDSLLVQLLVTSDTEKRMPLSALPLPTETIDLIRRWIDSGANEGPKPDTAAAASPAPAPRRTRKLEVLLTTDAVPPKGLLGPMNPARLELALLVGPLAPVTAVVFSPDGSLLATGSYGRVTAWDLAAGRPVKVLTNVLGAVNDLRFSPDGKLLAVAGGQPSFKGDLRLYSVEDWKLLASLGGHDDVVASVAFHPDGQRLASASFDKTVRLWDVASHKPERVLTGHSDFVYSVAFGGNGHWLVSASKDRSVKLIDTPTGKGRLTFSGMDQDVLAVAVSPDGQHVVSSGFESGLYWWNPQTGQRLRVQGGHGVAVQEIAFSKDGKLVVSAGADKTVRLWNGATGAPLRTLSVGSLVYAAAISPNSRLIASGSFDGLVRLWDVATGRQLLTILAPAVEDDRVEWLALTPEGYGTASPGLSARGQWRMAGLAVLADKVWPVLQQPEAVAKALRGEPLAPATFAR
jgi:hypothetical protein